MRFIEIDGVHINLNHVEFVGEIFGDPSYRRFTVRYSSGLKSEFKEVYYNLLISAITNPNKEE